MLNVSRSHTGAVSYYIRDGECTAVYSSFEASTKAEIKKQWLRMERAEKAVRRDAQVRTNYTMPMPNHYTAKMCIDATLAIIKKTGIANCNYTIAVHEGKGGEVAQNQHVHLIVNERSKITGKKDRTIQGKQFLKTFREVYNHEIAADMGKAHIPRERIPMSEWKSGPKVAREAVENFKAMEKNRIDELRQLPLVELLESLGAVRDKSDRHNWRTPKGERLTLDAAGFKFFNHTTGKGGGGAIDLVMALQSKSFSEALDVLTGLKPEFAPKSSITATFAPLPIQTSTEPPKVAQIENKPLPPPDWSRWQPVRKYLITHRKLNAEIVDQLHEDGKLYADSYGNAVFVQQSATGKSAYLRGTTHEKFHQQVGIKRLFLIGELKNPTKVTIVESAIDAISFHQWFKDERGLVVATGGQINIPNLVRNTLAKWPTVQLVAAFDNDPAGAAMTEQLRQAATSAGAPFIERPLPDGVKDWNQYIGGRPPDPPKQSKSQEQSKSQVQEIKRSHDHGFSM